MRKLPRPYTDPTPLFRHGGMSVPNGNDVLDFSASINPLGPPRSVLRALRQALPHINRYPDPHCRTLGKKLADARAISPDQFVFGNGSSELIQAIARALKPRRVAIVEPTYTEYLRASLLVGAEVDHWLAGGKDFTVKPFDPEGADLVWLCQPNNPTGHWCPLKGDDLRRWLAAFPKTSFVVDHSFGPLGAAGAWGYSDSSVGDYIPNLILVKSWTKFYAIPGLRIGQATAPPDVASRIRAEIPPWSVNALAQVALLAALDDDAFERRTTRWRRSVHQPFLDEMATLSSALRPIPSSANFVLARLKKMTAWDLAAELGQRDILIRPAHNFVGLNKYYFRVAMRTDADNQRLFAALRSVLGG